MSKILEAIKNNKAVIMKRGLIVVGAAAGLLIASKVLAAKAVDTSEETEVDEDETEEEEDDSEDEE